MTGGPSEEGAERSVPDELFLVLANPRRRRTLRMLDAADGPVPVDTVVDRLAATADDAASESIRTALHHSHLPKLADAGFVEFDGSAVELTDRGGRAAAALRAVLDVF